MGPQPIYGRITLRAVELAAVTPSVTTPVTGFLVAGRIEVLPTY